MAKFTFNKFKLNNIVVVSAQDLKLDFIELLNDSFNPITLAGKTKFLGQFLYDSDPSTLNEMFIRWTNYLKHTNVCKDDNVEVLSNKVKDYQKILKNKNVIKILFPDYIWAI